jgi:hypothetical protein
LRQARSKALMFAILASNQVPPCASLLPLYQQRQSQPYHSPQRLCRRSIFGILASNQVHTHTPTLMRYTHRRLPSLSSRPIHFYLKASYSGSLTLRLYTSVSSVLRRHACVFSPVHTLATHACLPPTNMHIHPLHT